MTALVLPHSPRAAVQALALAAVLAGVVGTAVSLDRGPPLPQQVAAETILAAEPHMGVACRSPSSIGCDRVGLEIELMRPARAVSATIAGRPLRLADTRSATRFTGFLEPAGIRERLHVTPASGELYWGIEPPSPVVGLRIDYGDRIAETTLQVRLMSDWG